MADLIKFRDDKEAELLRHGWQHRGDVLAKKFYTPEEMDFIRTIINSDFDSHYFIDFYTRKDFVFSFCYYGDLLVHFRYQDVYLIDEISEEEEYPGEIYNRLLCLCNKLVKDICEPANNP